MAMYFPIFAPKVFSPRVLVRESKTADFCLGYHPASDLHDYKWKPPLERTGCRNFWPSILNLSKRQALCSDLDDHHSMTCPRCCCCPYWWTTVQASNQFPTLNRISTCKCASDTLKSTVDGNKSDVEPETSPREDKRGIVSKRKFSDGINAFDKIPELADPFFGHQRIPQGGADPSPSKKVRVRRPKTYQCPYCEVCCSNQGQLKGHVRIHTGERPYRCTENGCNKAFIRNEELTRHRRIHTGERPHKCEMCGKAFSRKDHLNKHVKVHAYETDFIHM